MNDIPIFEDLLLPIILYYDIDKVEGNIISELARRSVQIHENFVGLFRYNNHICYVSNINAVFHTFRSPDCDIVFIGTSKLEHNLTTCS